MKKLLLLSLFLYSTSLFSSQVESCSDKVIFAAYSLAFSDLLYTFKQNAHTIHTLETQRKALGKPSEAESYFLSLFTMSQKKRDEVITLKDENFDWLDYLNNALKSQQTRLSSLRKAINGNIH